jgi:hypothetical protein
MAGNMTRFLNLSTFFKNFILDYYQKSITAHKLIVCLSNVKSSKSVQNCPDFPKMSATLPRAAAGGGGVGQTPVLNLSEDLTNVFFVQCKEKMIINIYQADTIVSIKQAMIIGALFRSPTCRLHFGVYGPRSWALLQPIIECPLQFENASFLFEPSGYFYKDLFMVT